MRTTVACAVLAVLAAGGSPALAQSWEASVLVGSTSLATIDRRAPELSQLDLSGGFTPGVQAAYFFAPHVGAEVLWTTQASGLEVGIASGKTTLFEATISQVHGNVVYRFSGATSRVQPFLFAGLGPTFFSASDLASETKLSLDIGGGLKYFPARSFGIRGHVRYKPIFLNDESAGDFCDPFGFCQSKLHQVEFAVGLVAQF
jgi:outer membrane protein W